MFIRLFKKSQLILCGFLSFVILLPQVFAAFDLSQLPAQIRLKNTFYTIQQVDPGSQEGILRFKVYSPHALYEIEGFVPLEKLLREIEVIERIKTQDGEGGFLEGASDSVEATAVGLGNLVVHPVDSAKGIGKAAGKLGKSIGGVFRKKNEGEKTSMGEKLMGSNRREVAKKIGADVYSRNPHIQSLINKIAGSRMGGQSAVMVIKFFIPIAAIASVAITAGGINSSADKMVNDMSRGELYELNKEAFLRMGFPELQTKNFLDSSFLTPREQTYFRFYLEALKKIEGYGAIFDGMLEAKTSLDALRKLYEAQMLAGSQPAPFAKIWSFPEGTAVLELSGRVVFFVANDYLDTGELGQRILGRVESLRAQNRMPVEIRNGGQISPAFHKQASRSNVSVKPWVFFETSGKNDQV